MSKYVLDKFLFTVDRDPELVERYRDDPVGTVAWWEAELGRRSSAATATKRSTWPTLTDAEREALATHDYAGCSRWARTRSSR